MTPDVLVFLLPPFVASLILTGIHTYLGLHVVERGVIFVDLSLAQVAALGSTVGFLWGADLHGPGAYWWSLGFTFLGAGVFSITRMRRGHIPHEAVIGIVYAVSAALAVTAMSQAPEGAEHIKDMLVGNILVVTWDEIWKTALLYGAVGIFHWIFRRQFLLITTKPEEAHRKGLSVRGWDLLFYVSFGFVVTSSVGIAGVLLVFSYLIVPSVFAMLFAKTVGGRLAVGWCMGTFVSAAGVLLSYLLDLPTGATIVCTFGITLLIGWAARMAIRQ